MSSLSHKYIAPILTIIFCSLIIVSCSAQPVFPESSIAHTFSVEEEAVQLLWSVNEVYVPQNDFQPMIAASTDLICILGDTEYPPQEDLTCLDSRNGTMKWQKTMRVPSGILMDSDGVYVSNGGVAGINKFDPTGKLHWDLSLLETSVKYMYLNNEQLQLFLLPEKFMTLRKDNGDRLAVFDGERIIYSTETERFMINYGLESRSLNLENVNWQLDLNSINMPLAPLFTDDLVFVRTGRVIGALLALDRHTGQTTWQTENNIVSNIAYWQAKDSLFALTRSGQLLKINVSDGEQSVLLHFSPQPFVLNGDSIVGGYEIAFDESNNILYLLLGDSRQLFAFKIE